MAREACVWMVPRPCPVVTSTLACGDQGPSPHVQGRALRGSGFQQEESLRSGEGSGAKKASRGGPRSFHGWS